MEICVYIMYKSIGRFACIFNSIIATNNYNKYNTNKIAIILWDKSRTIQGIRLENVNTA